MGTNGDEDGNYSALHGISAERAQRELTACLETAAVGGLRSGHWNGGRRAAADPIPSYQLVIAVPDRYQALTNGLFTWLVGRGPSGQLVSCSLPQEPDGTEERVAWLGQAAGAPYSSEVTVEQQVGGIGHPHRDGTGERVYAQTMVGRCADRIARVTVEYPGREPEAAVVARGVWFSQVVMDRSGGRPTVRGFDADGELVAWRPFGPVGR